MLIDARPRGRKGSPRVPTIKGSAADFVAVVLSDQDAGRALPSADVAVGPELNPSDWPGW